MTKQELRDQYVADGWTVQPIAEWRLVSLINGVEKFDVNVVSPDNQFFTAQVVIKDGQAYAQGNWKAIDESFTDRLRTFIRSMETGNVFAINVREVYEADGVAIVTAYINTAGVTTSNLFVVKERSNVFSYNALT